MKKTAFLMTAAVVGIVSIGAQAGDDDKVERTFDYTGFSEIEIAGVYNLDVEVGEDFGISLSGREKEMERVEVSLEGDTLVLSQKKKKKGWASKGTRKGITAKITLPALEGINISGVVDGEVQGVDSDEFDVNVSGVGDLEISGECGTLDARVSGVGDLDAKSLKCKNVDVRLSGVGDATVFASESVDAKVSGVGDIDVYGSPKKIEKSGGFFSDITVH